MEQVLDWRKLTYHTFVLKSYVSVFLFFVLYFFLSRLEVTGCQQA